MSDQEQKVLGTNDNIDREIICIFVLLGEKLGEDKFYIFKMDWLQDYFLKTYKGRKLPKNIKSFHCAIWEKDMSVHLDNWEIITNKFNL